jgi:replicative DNA helicase
MPKDIISTTQALRMTVDNIDRLFTQKHLLDGVSTGFKDIDAISGGLKSGELIIVAARPSLSKSSFVLNIAEHVAVEKKLSVLVYSPQIKVINTYKRMISSLGKINSNKIFTGQLQESDWENLYKAVKLLDESKLFMIDKEFMTVEQIYSKIIEMNKIEQLDLIILDSLLNIRPDSDSISMYSDEKYSEILKTVKEMAVALNIPVICTSKLCQGLEKRDMVFPDVLDLPSTSAFIKYTDTIMLIHRDDIYNEDSKKKGIADIWIRNIKSGGRPSGIAKLKFKGEYFRFYNLKKSKLRE